MIQVRAFSGLINRFFQVNFCIPGWKILDYGDTDQYQADAYFQINVKKAKTRLLPEYDFIAQSGKPYLVCESNIFRKNSYSVHHPSQCYYRLGWFHFLRSGNFNNRNSPPDRWNHIKNLQRLEIRPWAQRDGYVMLALQKPGDSTLNSLYEKFGSYQDWIAYALELINRYTDSPVLIRPHLRSTKLNLKPFLSSRVKLSETWHERTIYEGGIGLQKDLDGARAVVAYNSNCLVESTCEGIPSFPLSDESVVWDISNRIENLNDPDLSIDRTQWLYDAAYMIWNMDELNDGTAWRHLKPVFFPND